jgi:hypothetical protein
VKVLLRKAMHYRIKKHIYIIEMEIDIPPAPHKPHNRSITCRAREKRSYLRDKEKKRKKKK